MIEKGSHRFQIWRLERRIKREERILGRSQNWTQEEVDRLHTIRQMRSKLPTGHILPAREYLGDFFNLDRSKD